MFCAKIVVGVCEIVKLSASECEIMSMEDWVANNWNGTFFTMDLQDFKNVY